MTENLPATVEQAENVDPENYAMYTPDGVAVNADDLEALWNDPRYQEAVKAEEAAIGGPPQVSDADKVRMAAAHEPFDILEIESTDTQYGERWKLTIREFSGREAIMMLSNHPQRNSIIEAIESRMAESGREQKNVMLVEAFVSQGSPFYVLRPWDRKRIEL